MTEQIKRSGMQTLFAVITSKKLLLSALVWGWLEIKFLPKPMLMFCLVGCMALDLFTGINLSWKNGHATTSEGLEKTTRKLARYIAIIVGCWFLVTFLNQVDNVDFDYTPFINGCMGFLTFVELYSSFNNLYAADPDSILSRKLLGPILKFLRAKLDKNPTDDLNQKDK